MHLNDHAQLRLAYARQRRLLEEAEHRRVLRSARAGAREPGLRAATAAFLRALAARVEPRPHGRPA